MPFATPTASKTIVGQVFSQGMKAKPKRRSVSVSKKRKKPIFKLPKPVDDPLVSDDIVDSFRRAFWVKDMTYTTKLVFDDKDCQEAMNSQAFEP